MSRLENTLRTILTIVVIGGSYFLVGACIVYLGYKLVMQ
jgi:hypothetical protein